MSSEISEISEIPNSNKDGSIAIESPSNSTLVKKYEDILSLLSSETLALNYALAETIGLMENLMGRPEEEIDKVLVNNFVSQASKHLTTYPFDHYDNSTRAQLELFLYAVSSVVHVLSSNVNMIRKEARDPLYKSVSEFWATHRKSSSLNANIIFSLREIRNCLRKIKDDQSTSSVLLNRGGRIVDTVLNIVQKEYFAALGSMFKLLDFEYVTGEWYYDWMIKREEYFQLRRKCLGNDSELKNIEGFYRGLCELSVEEFNRVKRKDTKFRNLEYKMLKSGGAAAKCSLPDHIDTLLIGYLRLIQQIIEEKKFFPLIEDKYIKDTITLCNEIVEAHIKKQLTFKGVEVLFAIKLFSVNEEFKNEIESNFHKWYSIIPDYSAPSRSSTYSTVSSLQSITPPDTPTSSQSISTSPLQSYFNLPPTPTTPTTPTSNGKLKRNNSIKKIKEKVKAPKQVSYKRIIDDVIELFNERNKIYKNIYDTKSEYDKLSNDENVDKDSILLKLQEFLNDKKAHENDVNTSTAPVINNIINMMIGKRIAKKMSMGRRKIGKKEKKRAGSRSEKGCEGDNSSIEESNTSENHTYVNEPEELEVYENVEEIDINEEPEVVIINNSDDDADDEDAEELKLEYNEDAEENANENLETSVNVPEVEEYEYVEEFEIIKEPETNLNGEKDPKDEKSNEIDEELKIDPDLEEVFKAIEYQKYLDDEVTSDNIVTLNDNVEEDLHNIDLENNNNVVKESDENNVKESDENNVKESDENNVNEPDENNVKESNENNVNESDENNVKEFNENNYEIPEREGQLYLDNYEFLEGNDSQPLIYSANNLEECKEYDLDAIREMYPLDHPKVIKIIERIIIYENNTKQNEEEDTSFFAAIKRFVKDFETLVDKASKAHKAAVDERTRRLSNNSSYKSDVNNEKPRSLSNSSNFLTVDDDKSKRWSISSFFGDFGDNEKSRRLSENSNMSADDEKSKRESTISVSSSNDKIDEETEKEIPVIIT